MSFANLKKNAQKGEQLGLLLTHEEFERAVFRWVQNIDTMPIQEDPQEEGGI